ncbi:MAG TPA: DNA repair protein RadC [Ruminiclostridium sp.]|jgi:DNA repair protein RadC|nr:DNA repair protein RadC [Ruminiclostridium sp.]
MNQDIPESNINDTQIHIGHRERLKRRFLAEGLDNFEPHAVLEMILFYSVPRRDTNPIAHNLLKYFGGSLINVFDAPIEELMKVDGIGKNTATLIKLFPEVCRRYLIEMHDTGNIVKSSKDAAKCFVPLFIGRTNEIVAVMCLDSKGKILFCNSIFEGSINAVAVGVRRFVEIAVRYAATDMIMSHNHPGGMAIPSEQDILVTQKVSDALKTVNISLLDHIIVSGNDWVSLAATQSVSSIFPKHNGFTL